MPDIHGVPIADLRERVGSLAQVARVESFVTTNGTAAGQRRIRMVNGGGLEIEVHPERALDIGQVTANGIPFAWMSAVGIGSPDAYEPERNGWLRTFGGGLLATCGLDSFGPPDVDAGETLGQHGRIGTRRAEIVRADIIDGEVIVEGVVRQANVFGENLVMRRTISSELGSCQFRITDVVTNEGFRDQPHMVLYHLNLGWPLIDEGTTVGIPASAVHPRDAEAEAGTDARSEFSAPTVGFREQVYVHDVDPHDTTVTVRNSARGLMLRLRLDGGTLPAVHQWKMAGQGEYVLGVEPANTPVIHGRSAARAAGRLPMLAPGEQITHTLLIEFDCAAGAGTEE